MIGLTPPIPWGLLAAAVITVCVTAGGWTVLHGLRAADRAEIAALAEVARHNAAQAAQERAHAAVAAKVNAAAAEEQADAHARTEHALRALQEQWDARPTDDPCRLCSLDWPAERLQPDT